MGTETEISLKQILGVIRKNFTAILICTLLAAGATFGASKFLISKTYVSTVKLYVSAPNSSQSSDELNALNYAQKVVNTYIEMLQTNSFYQKVATQAKIDASPDDLGKVIRFSPLNDTEVFQAEISARSPAQAKRIADVVTSLAPATIAQLKEGATLKVVDSADLPEKPSSPKVSINTAIGFLIGLIGSVLFFLLREMLDVRIKSENDILQNYNVPVLASIPVFRKKLNQKNEQEAKNERAIHQEEYGIPQPK